MQRLFLTRRNLLTLISKLDRVKAGEESARTLWKRDTLHAKYPCTDEIEVIAVEDADYYTDRKPGRVHPEDAPPSERYHCTFCDADHLEEDCPQRCKPN